MTSTSLTSSLRIRLPTLVCACAWLLTTLVASSSPGAQPERPEHGQRFRLALPGYPYLFPRDHGSHDEFRTEWWYYTGHLLSEKGRRFGYQLTFFRRGVAQDQDQPNPSRWAIRHLYFAHFALTDVDAAQFRYAEKLSRAALGKAGAESGGLRVWIDRWVAETDVTDNRKHHLKASTDGFTIDLHLSPEKAPTIHGHDGISRKGNQPGQASHYYSVTRLATQGAIIVNGERLAVQGLSWMDHEFGSTDLGEGQVGWDWFSVQLDDRSELMFYVLRRADGTSDAVSSGTFLSSEGRSQHLSRDDVRIGVLDHWTSHASAAQYPSRWRISVPSLDLALTLSPLLADQELVTRKSTHVTYWEGAVAVAGTRGGSAVSGHGYVELTGYAQPFTKRL